MLSGIRKFCDYLFAFQFLLKSIIDMLTDSLDVGNPDPTMGTVNHFGHMEYPEGSSVTLRATATQNYTFLCWSDGTL